MRDNVTDLMPLIVEALMDGAAVTKREVAVATLGQVVQSTGYAMLLCCFIICNFFSHCFAHLCGKKQASLLTLLILI